MAEHDVSHTGLVGADPEPSSFDHLLRRLGDGVPAMVTPDTAVAASLVPLRATLAERRHAALLLEFSAGDAVLVPMADAHLLPRGPGGSELLLRASALAEALHHERRRRERRLLIPDLLLAYADALLAARTDTEVYVALREAAEGLVNAWRGVVYVASGPEHEAAFAPLPDPTLSPDFAPLPAVTATWFVRPVVVTRAEVQPSPPHVIAPLAAIMAATGAVQLLCAPVAGDALLVLLERRRHGVLSLEDRDLLGALLRQAEGALRRIVLEREARAEDSLALAQLT